ncbi:MAG TPA: AAA family ATPase [Bacillota bacterium]|nr:AAA family ATPase [Bacillota bacterium]
MNKKKIPIGISDFKEIIEAGYYYIDKSPLIKKLIEDGSKMILLPRPRRFGKTLNMTMLRYFFEKTGEDNSLLFQGLKIWNEKTIRERQGKYPMIYLTFKDMKYNHWGDCLSGFKSLLSQLYLEVMVKS